MNLPFSRKRHVLLILPLLTTANAVFSAEPGEWESSIELGFVTTSGNTETETLNIKASTATDQQHWRHKLGASVLKASDADQTTAEKYSLSGKSDYKLEGKSYLFGTATYEDDRFSGFDYQLSAAAGYGFRFIDEQDKQLDLEIGPGARQSKLDNGDTETEGLLRLGATFAWKISDTSKFGEVFTVEAGEDSTISKSETSLISQINHSLSMKLTLTVKNNSDVPPGVEKTDTETSATLVYSF